MTKKNLILGGILLVLLVLAFVYNGPFAEWKSKLGKPNNFLADVDIDDIDGIEISTAEKVVNINREDDKWKIEGTKGFYVDDGIVKTALDSLKTAQNEDLVLVSEHKDKKSEFETSEDTGYKLKLKKGDKVLTEFVVGKGGINFGSSYLAQINSDDTYLVKAGLRAAFGHDNWYDKTILALNKDDINKIRFQYPSREFTIEKKSEDDNEDSKWAGVLPYKFSINQEKIDKILDVVSKMRAIEIPAQTFEGTGLEKNNIIIQLAGKDIDSVIMIGDSNDNEQYYIKRGNSDNIYLVTKEDRDELEKRISDLR